MQFIFINGVENTKKGALESATLISNTISRTVSTLWNPSSGGSVVAKIFGSLSNLKTETQTWEALASDLGKTIDSLSENQDIVLICHSHGSEIVFRFLKKNPEMGKRTIVFNYGGYRLLANTLAREVYNTFHHGNFGVERFEGLGNGKEREIIAELRDLQKGHKGDFNSWIKYRLPAGSDSQRQRLKDRILKMKKDYSVSFVCNEGHALKSYLPAIKGQVLAFLQR